MAGTGRSASPDKAPRGRSRAGRGRTPAKGAARVGTQPEASSDESLLEVTNTIEPGARSAQPLNFDRIVEDARASPQRPRATRSQAPPEEMAAPPVRQASRGRQRQITPDQEQLQRDLRKISEEADDQQPQQPQSQPQQQPQDQPPSSTIEQSSVSWVTERVLVTAEERARQAQAQAHAQAQAQAERQPQPHPPRQPQSQPPKPQQAQQSKVPPQQQQQPQHNIESDSRAKNTHKSTSRPPARPPMQTADQSSSSSPGPATGSSTGSASNSPVDNIPVLHPTTQTAPVSPIPITKGSPVPPSGAHSFASEAGRRPLLRRNFNFHFTLQTLVTIFFVVLATFGALFAYRDNFNTTELRLPFSICSGSQSPVACGNPAHVSDGLKKLSSAVDSKLARMANEMATIKEEVNSRLADIPNIREELYKKLADNPTSSSPLAPLRVNFFSIGMGAVVDPYLTSPALQTSATSFVGRVARRLVGVPLGGMAPAAALQPWREIGECWCSPGSQPQMAVLLGYPIVPEEVVVEHISKEATLDPSLAPSEMELWAEYSAVTPEELEMYAPDSPLSPTRSGHSRDTSSRPSPSSRRRPSTKQPQSHPHPSTILSPSEHDYLLSTLRMSFPGEPDTAFSDNPRLGPTFFRLGKWQYDINGPNNVQNFKLDAAIDLPGFRVRKVIVRATSNWGGSHTCLYRVRLHGRL